MADRRVKLVFADELGRFLLRKRGFSSCWFLVPPSAKIVGDLAHEICHEFGLSMARCPSGVDLVLEKLHLLPSHDIRIVRDNDEICVQCSSSSELAGSRSGALGGHRRQSQQLALLEASDEEDDDEDEVLLQQEKHKERREKRREKKKGEAVVMSEETEKMVRKNEAKVTKRVEKTRKSVMKKSDSSDDSSNSDSDSADEEKQQPVAATKQKKRKATTPLVESSDSSSSSSSSSSDSSASSSSDSEDEKKQSSKTTLQPDRKRQRVEASKTGTTSRQTLKAAVSAKKPGLVVGKANGGGEPRQRRRRRPRNRKPRGEHAKRSSENGTAATVATTRSAALPTAPGDRPTNPIARLPPPVQHNAPAVSQSTDPLSAAIVKGHVRFGDAGESRLVQQSIVDSNGKSSRNGGDALTIRKPRAYVSPELQKYGPQHNASNNDQDRQQQSPPPCNPSARSTNGHHNRQTNGYQPRDAISAQAPQDDAVDSLANGPSSNSKKKKAKWDTLWKRPYEIVATIHDQTPQNQPDEVNSITSVVNLLTSLPASAVPATSLQTGDVIAYKTLTLCMETWQPIVSAWLCGQVLVSGEQLMLLPMTLFIDKDGGDDGKRERLRWSIDGGSKPSSTFVQAGEISELRCLDGPSSQPPLQ